MKNTMRFSDGMSIETSGEYQIIRQSDGLYVVGHGTLAAVDTYEEGRQLIRDLEQVRTGSSRS